MSEPEPERRTTTAAIYADDLDYLKRVQLRASDGEGKWLPMVDVIHELIRLARETAGEEA